VRAAQGVVGMVDGSDLAGPEAGTNEPRVAVIGGGVAGLACARALVDGGVPCLVLEKSRNLGGRAATRREGERDFDHGAPSLTARGAEFAAVVNNWRASGGVQDWTAVVEVGKALLPKVGEDRLVVVPGMSAIGRLVGGELKCETSTVIISASRDAGSWRLTAADGRTFGPFAAVAVAVPAPQAVPFLAAAPALAERAASVEFAPCWTVIVEFAGPVTPSSDLSLAQDGVLAWAVHEASRPGRLPGERWVLHANARWSTEHIEAAKAAVVDALLASFAARVGEPMPEVVFAAAHRWRYALAKNPLGAECLWDAPTRLGACGDWCASGDIEGAWRSGRALAAAMLAALG